MLRTYLRQRESWWRAGTCIQQMQKVLTQMNVQLANVLSDLSGSRAGDSEGHLERRTRPYRLAALADPRVQAAAKKSPKLKGIGEKISCCAAPGA